MSVFRALTIAGSDSGGGAGIQADLKAFAAAGVHGMSAIVALTAQNTVGVRRGARRPAGVRARATRRGVLRHRRRRREDGDALDPRDDRRRRGLSLRASGPLVVDPVLVASSGATLLAPDAVGALVERLFPLARVVTPNLPEARALCGGGEGAPRARARRAAGRARRAPRRSSRAGTAIRSTTSSTVASTSSSRSSDSIRARRTVRAARIRRRSPRCSRGACRSKRRRVVQHERRRTPCVTGTRISVPATGRSTSST